MQATGFASEGGFCSSQFEKSPSHFDSLPLGKNAASDTFRAADVGTSPVCVALRGAAVNSAR